MEAHPDCDNNTTTNSERSGVEEKEVKSTKDDQATPNPNKRKRVDVNQDVTSSSKAPVDDDCAVTAADFASQIPKSKLENKDSKRNRLTKYAQYALSPSFAEKEIFAKLRDKKIAAKYNEIRGKIKRTDDALKMAYNNWQTTSDAVFKPFKSLKDHFINSPDPLSYGHSRLFLEDYLLLRDGEQVLCYISSKHPFIAHKKDPIFSHIEESLRTTPLRPRKLTNQVFFCLRLLVKSNPKRKAFLDGTISKEEMEKQMKEEAGHGVTFQMPNMAEVLIKYHNLIQHADCIQFWKTWNTPGENTTGSRIRMIKNILKKKNCIIYFSAATHVYLEECCGDHITSIALGNYHTSVVNVWLEAEKHKKTKEAPISDDQLVSALRLSPDDGKFILFRHYVDSKTKLAFESVNGDFSTLTDPLLSIQLLSDLANKFEEMLPSIYKAIIAIMYQHSIEKNKKRHKEHEPQRQRYALYIFIMLMRIRNNKNFIWWAKCNAANELAEINESHRQQQRSREQMLRDALSLDNPIHEEREEPKDRFPQFSREMEQLLDVEDKLCSEREAYANEEEPLIATQNKLQTKLPSANAQILNLQGAPEQEEASSIATFETNRKEREEAHRTFKKDIEEKMRELIKAISKQESDLLQREEDIKNEQEQIKQKLEKSEEILKRREAALYENEQQTEELSRKTNGTASKQDSHLESLSHRLDEREKQLKEREKKHKEREKLLQKEHESLEEKRKKVEAELQSREAALEELEKILREKEEQLKKKQEKVNIESEN